MEESNQTTQEEETNAELTKLHRSIETFFAHHYEVDSTCFFGIGLALNENGLKYFGNYLENNINNGEENVVGQMIKEEPVQWLTLLGMLVTNRALMEIRSDTDPSKLDLFYGNLSKGMGIPLVTELAFPPSEPAGDKGKGEDRDKYHSLSQDLRDQGVALFLNPKNQDEGTIVTIDPFAREPIELILKGYSDTKWTIKLVNPDVLFPALRRARAQSPKTMPRDVGIGLELPEKEKIHVQRGEYDQLPHSSIVNYVIQRAKFDRASDIHVNPGENTITIQYRREGSLIELMTLPAGFLPGLVSVIKIHAGMDVAEKRRPQDGRISMRVGAFPLDLRVSTFPTVLGEKVVMRLLDPEATYMSLDKLTSNHSLKSMLERSLNAPFGLIIISGPTGSGKTTTLYTCLRAMAGRNPPPNIMTVEDPVEYRMPWFRQMEVHEEIGVTFAKGLRTILRQDPNVIMVGEIRDEETAAMAVQAAVTGHIVFSTVHANTAVGVVTRLRSMGVDSYLVANSLRLAVAQRLVRKLCGCSKTEKGNLIRARLTDYGFASAVGIDPLRFKIDDAKLYRVARQGGCPECNGTGYRGRIPLFEMFEMTRELRSVVGKANFDEDALTDHLHSQPQGFKQLSDHALEMINSGTTDYEEIIHVLGG